MAETSVRASAVQLVSTVLHLVLQHRSALVIVRQVIIAPAAKRLQLLLIISARSASIVSTVPSIRSTALSALIEILQVRSLWSIACRVLLVTTATVQALCILRPIVLPGTIVRQDPRLQRQLMALREISAQLAAIALQGHPHQ
jgi:hypothetical protein